MALLRTCRQIYAEAALMPLTLNTFSFKTMYEIRRAFQNLKAHQRKQVTAVDFEIRGPVYKYTPNNYGQMDISHLRKLLPGLKDFCIRHFPISSLEKDKINTDVQQSEHAIQQLFAPCFEGTSIVVMVEQKTLTWRSYDDA
jgi:hypothetical protein